VYCIFFGLFVPHGFFQILEGVVFPDTVLKSHGLVECLD